MTVRDSLTQVLATIDIAAKASGREAREITLIAVSKKQPVDLMRHYQDAAQQLGIQVTFGENYVQELKAKRSQFGQEVEFHLIGPLQRNKIRDAVRCADVIESVHAVSILEEIAKEAASQGKQQRIFIQVNIGNDPHKSGFSEAELPQVIARAAELAPHLLVCGLMTITPLYEKREDVRADFRHMRELRERIVTACRQVGELDPTFALSMGMSADFDIAIEEGADAVRVGTALFGERP